MTGWNTPTGFHDALNAVIDGRASHSELRSVITFAHKLALAYIRVASVSLFDVFQRLGMSPEDAAYDAIAQLFARTEDNRYPALTRWRKSIPPASTPNENLLALAYRRLIIGSVHQRAFQCYHDTDPHLSKIIRNIKLALKRHPSVKQSVVHGSLVVIPRKCRALQADLPAMPHELLLPEIFDAIASHTSLKEMLDAIGRILLAQREYRRMLPVIETALLVREVYLSDVSLSTMVEPSDGLSVHEIGRMVDSSVRAVRQSTLANYQQRGTLTQQEAEAHESALADILRTFYIDSDGREECPETFRVMLQRHMPGLTRVDYHKKHRVILEYLVKNCVMHLRKAVRGQNG
jgi:hypothetical protein